MSAFVAGAAVLLALAAAFVAWPLGGGARAAAAVDARRASNLAAWRAAREELDRQLACGALPAAEHAQACVELDRRLLEEAGEAQAPARLDEGGRRVLVLGLFAVPVAALLLYAAIGAHDEVRLAEALAGLERIEDPAERSVATVNLLPRLEAAARARDPEGNYRYLLARSYMTLGRYAEAAVAFAGLAALYPEDAGLLAQQAQALYLANDRRLSPAVQALVDRALTIDPAQVTLLGMVGMDRFQAGDYAGAVEAWEKLLARLPPDAPDATVIRDGIAMARARLGGEAAGASAHADPVTAGGAQAGAGIGADTGVASADGAAPAGAAGPGLLVSVRLADGRTPPPGATVFVFARAVGGPPMPLAVARFAVSELPRDVRLDDSMAMAPGMNLSRFAEVTVVARVSQSGTVAPQPGDLEGSSDTVRLAAGEQSVEVAIDRVL